MSIPTQRTLAALRDRGVLCDITERYIRFGGSPLGIRKDFLGFGDIVGIEPGKRGALAVQSCGSSYSSHLKTILDSECSENVIKWLEAGNRLELWGWRRVKVHRGGKAKRWKPRVREITLEDFGCPTCTSRG